MNFVFMTDTQNKSMVGAYGMPVVDTPNPDRLAASGIRFDRAYTACPLCTPARGAISAPTARAVRLMSFVKRVLMRITSGGAEWRIGPLTFSSRSITGRSYWPSPLTNPTPRLSPRLFGEFYPIRCITGRTL